MADVFLSLGANEGDRQSNIKMALALLSKSPGMRIKAVSSLYETGALGVSSQPDFINCVARINTNLEPADLLSTLKSIESTLGREPRSHMQPRPIDIDILIYDGLEMQSENLRIPHSRLTQRRFVLEPLLEIKPDAIDPVSKNPLVDYLNELRAQKVEKIKESSEVWNAR